MAERVYDELLCFLGDPTFQIPVRTFMDENCMIFDPSIPAGDEHRAVHEEYKYRIDSLLGAFCQDVQIKTEDAVKGVQNMCQIPDLKEVFHVLFEQVMAATDFEIFVQVMSKRNIMIQEQVLAMILAATGSLPESLQELQRAQAAKAGGRGASAPKPMTAGADDLQEEQLLKQVMIKSQSDEEKRSKVDKAKKQQEQEQLKKTIEISQQEARALQEDRMSMEQNMKRLALEKSPNAPASATQSAAMAMPSAKVHQQAKPPSTSQRAAPRPTAAAPGVSKESSSEAANQWLASAQAEAGQSSAHTAIAASLAKLSPNELKQRQEYLREQRDKLLAMKKEAREKQLGTAEKSGPQRPQSARAACSAMRTQPADSAESKEDEKKMAMRRAIADKLKQEVIGKN